jgi:hypothetical protein
LNGGTQITLELISTPPLVGITDDTLREQGNVEHGTLTRLLEDDSDHRGIALWMVEVADVEAFAAYPVTMVDNLDVIEIETHGFSFCADSRLSVDLRG